MEKELFGTHNGIDVYKYTLKDDEGNSISVLNYGATIQSLVIKNSNGEFVDVVLGFNTLEEYKNHSAYFGAVCGRVCNRIQDAKFYIEGEEYNLIKNNANACLHGGFVGFDKLHFDLTNIDTDFLEFSVFSMDNDEGFPGNVSLKVKYTFKNKLLLIEYTATSTKTTPLNITNHTYFNLDGKGDIKNHSLQLNSNFYMPVFDDGVATGEVLKTKNTPFDFKEFKKLGDTINLLKVNQPAVNGLDNHFFIDYAKSMYRKFGTLKNEDESLFMDIYSNQTGTQIYTGNFIDDMMAKNNKVGEYSGVAIETQLPANNLNFSYLPSMLLNKGEVYKHKTGFKFY